MSIIVLTIMIGYLIYWIWAGLPANINTSGNSTIALNEIAAQSVPTLVNGIITSTGIIIAFSIAVSALLMSYVFKEDRERKVIVVILAIFPIPIIFQFFAYITLAGGQGLFGFALRFALASFLYSLFALMCILTFASFRMYEREKTPQHNSEELPSDTEPKTREPKDTEDKRGNKNVNVFVNVS